ncbi:endonuclease/exonuclease/phosphatase family protein [Mycoplasma sp. 1654_15]|uniref:endonuclease/exonuclease/phosphatase family protein n=1 Tax=Mycoplasma sp. 1654_15 TaxID=2725994 RepID=UPI001599BB96|nr:hypothetical protein [Mycoplasma sp. 1654_15]QKG28164.1 endonuclease/exonuclease/phosphatase family protein [Mycoplasma sp. 1654_15]
MKKKTKSKFIATLTLTTIITPTLFLLSCGQTAQTTPSVDNNKTSQPTPTPSTPPTDNGNYESATTPPSDNGNNESATTPPKQTTPQTPPTQPTPPADNGNNESATTPPKETTPEPQPPQQTTPSVDKNKPSQPTPPSSTPPVDNGNNESATTPPAGTPSETPPSQPTPPVDNGNNGSAITPPAGTPSETPPQPTPPPLPIKKPEKSTEEKQTIDTTELDDQNVYQANKDYIKVGFWNILNYNDNIKDKKDSFAKTYKAKMLAKTIEFNNADIVGLVEVNSGQKNKVNGVDSILETLNKDNQNAQWKSVVSDAVHGQGNEGQHERIAFIYKASVLDILEINKEKLYGSNPYLINYENPLFDSVPAYFATHKAKKGKVTFDKKLTTKKVDFVRPPVAAKFKLKNSEQEFVLVASHFDAPGVNSNPVQQGKEEGEVDNTKYDSKNGSQEISEANHMLDTMNWFEQKTQTPNQFFMADTNIHAASNDNAFEKLLTQYKLLISKDENTSLGSTFDKYSSSYDKIFFKKEGSLTTKNVYKYPLYDVVKDKLTTEDELTQVLNSKAKKGKPVEDIKDKIKDLISDHSPVFVSIKKAIKKKDN